MSCPCDGKVKAMMHPHFEWVRLWTISLTKRLFCPFFEESVQKMGTGPKVLSSKPKTKNTLSTWNCPLGNFQNTKNISYAKNWAPVRGASEGKSNQYPNRVQFICYRLPFASYSFLCVFVNPVIGASEGNSTQQPNGVHSICYRQPHATPPYAHPLSPLTNSLRHMWNNFRWK